MAEEMERRAKDIYKKPAGAGKKAVVEEYEEVINLNDEESGFGVCFESKIGGHCLGLCEG